MHNAHARHLDNRTCGGDHRRMSAPAPLWLSDADVVDLIEPMALIAALRRGFAAVEAGEIREPPAATMQKLDGGSSYLTVFPTHDRRSGLASVKMLAGRPANALDGRPEIDAVVALAEAGTGRIAALVAARSLTALRTAAVTAIALDALMAERPAEIGLAGTGAQAQAHARVLAAAGLASSFVAASPRRGLERAAALAAEIAQTTGLPARAAPVEAIAVECEILCTMTLARRPLPLGALGGDRILACIGPFLPEEHEIDPALLARADLVVSDHPERLQRQWAESELIDPGRIALRGLSSLLQVGDAAPSRGLRIFLSDGRGFEDNIAATLALDAARRAGRGLQLP